MRALRRYAEMTAIQAKAVLVFRADYVFGLVGVLLQIFLLRVVWTSVYDGAEPVDGVSLSTVIAYSTLANIASWLLNPWAFTFIPDRVRQGQIAADLSRPVPFLGQVLSIQLGGTVASLPYLVALIPFAFLIGGAEAPASTGAAFGYVVTVLLAYTINALLSLMVGLTAFWTTEIGGFYMIYRMVAQFLAGTLVPLWLMPGALRTVAQVLPFQATSYTPTAIYLGRIHGAEIWGALGVQLLWIAVLWALVRLMWSRALYRVVVQGG